jgi:hypothetical protein
MRLRSFACAFTLLSVSALLGACGSSGGGGACGFGEDEYLPLDPGQRWTFRVTDATTGERTTKVQTFEAEPIHPDYGEVVRQVTTKVDGRTESLFGREGDRVLRFEQVEYDAGGAFMRRTRYQPPRLRVDSSPDRLVAGAVYEESLVEIEEDEQGNLLEMSELVERWEVLGVDVECTAPLGTFSCLHLRRTRLVGGSSDKEFSFARGIGKVREDGSQIEEVATCGHE